MNRIENPSEDFEALLEEFSTPEAIEAAKKDKTRGETKPAAPIDISKSLPSVQDRLDLHNLYLDEALRRTTAYINNAIRNGLQTVEIITGKGHHSKNATPVLRGRIFERIMELKRQGLVLSARWEKKTESKSGSIIVYLKN